MIASATVMNEAIELLRPYWITDEARKMGKEVIWTVAGYMHYIGKDTFPMMLEAIRFDVVDLGVDVPMRCVLKR